MRTVNLFSCISFVILARLSPVPPSSNTTKLPSYFVPISAPINLSTPATLYFPSSDLATPLIRSCYNSVAKLNEILTSQCVNFYYCFWLLRLFWIHFSGSFLALNVSVVGLERALAAYLKEPTTQPFDMKTVPIATQSIHEQKPIKTSE